MLRAKQLKAKRLTAKTKNGSESTCAYSKKALSGLKSLKAVLKRLKKAVAKSGAAPGARSIGCPALWRMQV
eukprot:4716347-Alexandrium_andersonii.AAC.1